MKSKDEGKKIEIYRYKEYNKKVQFIEKETNSVPHLEQLNGQQLNHKS